METGSRAEPVLLFTKISLAILCRGVYTESRIGLCRIYIESRGHFSVKKRIFAVVLSFVLLLGALCVPAFAEEQLRYVVLGDSIAHGSGLSNPTDAVYGRIVADTNGYAYENYAVPGHTTQAMLRRMENEKVAGAIADADIISISIGGNNFLLDNLGAMLFNGIVKKDFSRMDTIAEKYDADLRQIVEKILNANPDVTIVLQTIYNPQTAYVGMVYQQGADRLNAVIETVAADNADSVLVADVAGALNTRPDDFAKDGIHPSAQGNEKIAVVVLKTLADAGLGTATEPVINTPGKDMPGVRGNMFFVNFFGFVLNMLGNLYAVVRIR